MKVRINDNPTGPEVIALHQEATTDFVYLSVCVCVSVHASRPSAGCQGDALTMATAMDAVVMRAQSCIHDSAVTQMPQQ